MDDINLMNPIDFEDNSKHGCMVDDDKCPPVGKEDGWHFYFVTVADISFTELGL